MMAQYSVLIGRFTGLSSSCLILIGPSKEKFRYLFWFKPGARIANQTGSQIRLSFWKNSGNPNLTISDLGIQYELFGKFLSLNLKVPRVSTLKLEEMLKLQHTPLEFIFSWIVCDKDML